MGITVAADLVFILNIAKKNYSIKESALFIAEMTDFCRKLVVDTKYWDRIPTKILDDKKFRSIFPDYEFYDHKTGIEETAKYFDLKL